MNFSMTEQEKGDLSIQVTDWTGLTVHVCMLVKNIHYFDL